MPDNTNSGANQSSKSDEQDGAFRFNLAKWIIVFVFSVTGVVGIAAIEAAALGSEKSYSAIKDILGYLLPVLSAWAGTVLAFYFSRENFETAARSTASLVKQFTSEEKLKSIIVRDVMIDIAKATTLILDKPEKEIKLKADIIDAKLEKEKRERLPILDKQGTIKYMVHRSLFDKFMLQEVSKGKKLEDLTLQDMLDNPGCNEILTKSFQTLRTSSNLLEAKTLMEKITICSDVMATEDGSINSKVVGWVTNVIVGEQSRV